MNTDVDGTPFSVLMDRAVKLKTLQMSQERKNYDKMPSFYQHSIFMDDVQAVRNLDFIDRIAAARQMKDDGNDAFKQGHWDQAMMQYEKALSVFRYLENTNPQLKNQGIKDQHIQEIAYQCKDEDEAKELNLLLVSLYNNIAITCFKMKDYNTSIQACDYALAVEDKSDKSYYLRAKSRLAPASSGSVELEAALADLKRALEINPLNTVARKLLQTATSNARLQKSRDRSTFNGLFDRGEMYDAKELSAAKRAQDKAREIELKASRERDLIIGKQLVQQYEERGMEEEKRNVKSSVNAEIERRNNAKKLTSLDFRNPNQEMIEDAKSMGVDLLDPRTVDLLEKLQKGERLEPVNSKVSVPTTNINYVRTFGFVAFVLLCLRAFGISSLIPSQWSRKHK